MKLKKYSDSPTKRPGMCVVTADGEEYVIANNATGRELFALDLEAVRISGRVGQDDHGKLTITVS